MKAHCTLGPLVGFHNTNISVKLTIFRIKGHLLDGNLISLLLYAVEYLPLITKYIIFMRILSPNFQILTYSFQIRVILSYLHSTTIFSYNIYGDTVCKKH